MRLLGKKNNEEYKFRLNLAGSLEDQWHEISDELSLSYSSADKLWHNLDNIEIDIWVDNSGNVTVGGAW